MRTLNRTAVALLFVVGLCACWCGTLQAQDDGPRAHWNALTGTNVVSLQTLLMNANSSTGTIDPIHLVYPQADVDATLFMAMYGRFVNVFGRSSIIGVALYGGSLRANVVGDIPGVPLSPTLAQSAQGFGDPVANFRINVYGAPALPNFYVMAGYEPKITFDLSLMSNIPIGQRNEDRLINLGVNRWWGRVAVPVMYNVGSWAPGHRTTIEVMPAVWLTSKNDDFLGHELKNDPMYQLEAHVTHDLTKKLFGSIDYLGFFGLKSEIDGVQTGDDLIINTVGVTVGYMAARNLEIRFAFNGKIGDTNQLEASMIRIQFNYFWHPLVENITNLSGGH